MCFTTVNPWEASRKYSDVNATGNNTAKGAWRDAGLKSRYEENAY